MRYFFEVRIASLQVMFCIRVPHAKSVYFSTSLIILFTLLTQCIIIGRQEIGARYDRVSTADGLSSNTVNQIIEDDKGFIYIATSSGLDRTHNGLKIRRVSHNESYDVTGMGLSVSQKNKSNPLRDLWVDSELGHGSKSKVPKFQKTIPEKGLSMNLSKSTAE